MNVLRCLAALVLLLAGSLCHAATTQYYYDDLGRIVQAVRSDGAVFQYQYDANGNVLAINRISASSVSIAELTPRIGQAGATVTISGTGFNATPAQNTVTFSGGAQGTVTFASTTILKVTVPQAAQSGTVSVTVSGNTATSAMNYTVRRPAITSFSPLAINAGGTVTITGSYFNLVPGGTSINVGGVAASITALSNSQATFIPGAGTTHGAIQIVTPYGSATSATALIIAPSGIAGGNIDSTAVLTANGSQASISSTAANRSGVYTFQGTAGQYLSIHVTLIATTPANQPVAYRLYSPAGALIAQGDVGSLQRSQYFPKLQTSGTHLIVFYSIFAAVQLSIELVIDAPLQSNVSLAAATQTVGHGRRFIYTATAGDTLGIAITNVVTAPTSAGITVAMSLVSPDGNGYTNGECYTFSVPGCSWPVLAAPMTGDYQLYVTPTAQVTTSYSVTMSSTTPGTLTSDVAQMVPLSVAGKPALLTFTATANQTFALYTSAVTTVPAGKSATIWVFNSSSGMVATFPTASEATVALSNLPAGTYRVLVQLSAAATGSLQLHLASGLAGTLLADGVTRSFANSVPGQFGNFTFSATAGDNLALAITNVATAPASGTVSYGVYMPNGGLFNGNECSASSVPGCSLVLRNLPQTGTYRVEVGPGGMRTMSFGLTLSQSVMGTLTPNVAMPINLAVPGQQTVLTFTATSGQSFTVTASSIATSPASKSVSVVVVNPSGGLAGQGSGTTTASVSLSNLAAGTYSVVVIPNNASTATMNVTLQ